MHCGGGYVQYMLYTGGYVQYILHTGGICTKHTVHWDVKYIQYTGEICTAHSVHWEICTVGKDKQNFVLHSLSLNQRGLTYIESDRITTSAPMESADQAARAGSRVSTTWLSCRTLYRYVLCGLNRVIHVIQRGTCPSSLHYIFVFG